MPDIILTAPAVITIADATTSYNITIQLPADAITPPITPPVTPPGGAQIYPVRSPAYFVAPTGSDSAAGTEALPFATLARARDAMRGGPIKTTYLRGGTYAQHALLSLNDAAGDVGTTWSNYPGERPILDCGGGSFGAFDLQAPRVWINGFTIRNIDNRSSYAGHNTTGPAISVFFGVQTDARCRITNCEIYNVNPHTTDTHGAAVMLEQWAQGCEVSHCYIHDCGAAGVQGFDDSSPAFITDNRIERCTMSDPDIGAIDFYSPFGLGNLRSRYYLIARNKISDTGQDGDYARHHVYLDDMVSNYHLFGNWMWGWCDSPWQLHGGVNNRFTNNVFDLTNARALGYYQVSTTDAAGKYHMAGNASIANITYSASATPPQSGRGGIALGDADFNGTVLSLMAGSSNLHHSPAYTLPNHFAGHEPVATHDDWHGADVVDADPLFVDAAGHDYSLRPGSPALTMAAPFLAVAPGAGPSLAGLPPIWAPQAGNIVRTPDPRVGSTWGTQSGELAELRGGTLPRYWVHHTLAGLAYAIVWTGTQADGTPAIRIRYFGKATGTALRLDFDQAAPAKPGVAYTSTIELAVCAGSMAGIVNAHVFVQTKAVNLAATPVILSGIPAVITTTCPATAAGTASLLQCIEVGVTVGAMVDITLEVAAPQVVA